MMKKIIPVVFLYLIIFSGYIFAQKKKPDLFSIKQNGLCGYINKTGKIIIKSQFNTCWGFSEGLSGVIINDKLGFIDEAGNFVIQPQFNYDLVSFSEGFATIQFGSRSESTEQVGFVDTKGKITILPSATLVFNFSEGVAIFEKAGLYGYVDINMNIIIEPQYKYAGSFYDGLAKVIDKNNNSYYIDKTGQKTIDRDGRSFSEGLASFEVKDNFFGSKYGFIDTKGNIVIQPQFRNTNFFYEGLCAVEDSDTYKWGFIDKTGKFVIKPQFEEVERFSEGLAQVKIDDKWGYINKAGKIVIPAKFDEVDDFNNGIAPAKIDDNWNYYINKSGNFIWNP